MFEVTKIFDTTENGLRRASFLTCAEVCSERIDIELEDDIVRRVQYTKGCHGNTQGVAALCAGMKKDEVIARLEGIDCKGRGTSCPDQLARALRQL
ncbi:MAG: TIGR03905 family TSCPD domain-containing protein [Bacteroidales bacterium]|nr:TIGR03905 family TSCPD domain-containing protein [Bacteroidales bacterium]